MSKLRRGILIGFNFLLLFSLSTLFFDSSSSPQQVSAEPNIADEATACAFRTFTGYNAVYGFSWFSPDDITVSSSGKTRVNIRTFVCNATTLQVNQDYIYFGNNRVVQTGQTNVLDFAPSGLPSVSGYRRLAMGPIAAGSYSLRSFQVDVDGSKFSGGGNYQIAITGFGDVYYANAGCPWPYACRTNVADSILNLTIKRPVTARLDTAAQFECEQIEGYAYIRDFYSETVQIRVYRDGLRGLGGTYSGSTNANLSGPDNGAPGNHRFRFPISRYADAYSRSFYVYAYVDSEYKYIGGTTVGPCAPPECGSFSVDAANGYPESGETFSATASVDYNRGSSGRSLTYDIILNIVSDPNDPSTGVIDAGVTDSPNRTDPPNDSYTFTGLRIDDPPGQYYARWRIRWGSSPGSGNFTRSVFCTIDDVNVGAKPYLKIYANDVFAGGEFDTDLDGVGCTAIKESDIFAWQSSRPLNNGSNSSVPTGSSVEYAAYALGQIDEFGSAGLRRGDAPPTADYRGLIFGNFEGSGKQMIGDHPSQGRCIPNYMENAADSGVPGGTISSLTGGTQTYESAITLTGATVSGSNTLYVKGDVVITGDITLAGYSSINSIPTLHIVADGDIWVDRNVTQVAGIYISKGKVVTCSQGASSYNVGQLFSNCNRKLTINGAVIANDVDFKRTNGTMSQATNNEPSSSGTIAEVFNFLPEIYLSQPEGWETERQKAGTKYDYITSLPPIL